MEENKDLKAEVEKPRPKVVRAVGTAKGTSTAHAVSATKGKFPHTADGKAIDKNKNKII